MTRTLLAGLSILALTACGGSKEDSAKAENAASETSVSATETQTENTASVADPADAQGTPVPALADVSEDSLRSYISVLASDEFEGRAPASAGGRKTREFLIDQMQAIGLEPGNKGSYEQAVGLVEMTAIPNLSSFSLMVDGEERSPEFGKDVVFWTKQVTEEVTYSNSELVFVGFGVNAPEYGWNDYQGLDVEGKTVVMLVNDPGFYLKGDKFNGEAMTYYGRWTYKYEEAARQGATAAIVIHDTAPASYGWGVVSGSWSGAQLDLERPDNGASRVKLEGWFHKDLAEELFATIDMSYEQAVELALSDDFEPVPMGEITSTGTIRNDINRSESANIAGVLPGTEDPDEYVLFTAHWDHLGKTFSAIGGGDGSGDTINNGAVDNASGTAALLAMAESFANAEVQPERSILFLAVTAEESGLLGSAYFAEDPFVPLKNIVGGINMDAFLPMPPAHDLTVVGYGKSEMEDILKTVADKYGKRLEPDPTPQAGYFYRSDHISLAKKGVPMIYVDNGVDLIDGGVEAGRAFQDEYTEIRYHKPADEYDDSWQLDGTVEVLNVLRDVGAIMAYGEDWPNWYEGDEFRGLRDEMRAGE